MSLEEGLSPNSSSVHALVFKHERTIRALISKRSGPAVLRRTSVDDLYQDTIAEAFASAGSNRFEFQGDAPFIQWISTIARRVITRSLRDPTNGGKTIPIRRSGSTGVGVPEALLLAPDRTPSSIVAGGDNRLALSDGLRRLPTHYQRVLRLYIIEQRPLGEVAEDLKRSKGATCRLIARATQALRAAVDGRPVPGFAEEAAEDSETTALGLGSSYPNSLASEVDAA